MPVNANTGDPAESDNPDTWARYFTALGYLNKHPQEVDGLGFMFGNGFVGVDVDHCVDTATGELLPHAREIRDLLNSYTEFSPSGTGLHIICRGTLPEGGRKNTALGLEMYSEGRFFTVTTDRMHGTEAEERTEQLKQLHMKYMKQERPQEERRQPTNTGGVLEDDELLEKAKSNRKTGDRFTRLWNGDWKGVFPSQSEADMALCNYLAYWCNGDTMQMDRLFRRSGLMRDKWEEAHYREETLDTAIRDMRDGYEYKKQPEHDDWIPGPDEDPTEAAPAAYTVLVRYEHERVPEDAAYFRHEGKRYGADDTGNAERFNNLYGANARYCHQHHLWYIWNGKVWQEDLTGSIKRMAEQCIGLMYKEYGQLEEPIHRKELLKQIRRVRGSNGKEAMIKETQHLSPILADEMDKDDFLLNCLNGVLDLNTGELLPHARERFITKIAPVEFVKDTPPSESWIKFLAEIIPDQDLRKFVQKAVGYSLTGSNVEQCLFVMFGSGANGKGTFIDVLRSMLGGYMMNAQAESVMLRERSGNAASSDLARLKGARFVTCPETEEGHRISEALVKQLTGNDTLTVRFLFGREFEYIPAFKIWLATNHKPVVKGTDNGFWRRMRLIPFSVTIPEEKRDPHLADRIKLELPGVLNWAIEGLRMWKAEGLQAPPAVRVATEQYRTEMDVLAAFLEECTHPGVDDKVSGSTLYAVYKGWCTANNERPLTTTKFGLRLVERGLEKKRSELGVFYLGLYINRKSEDIYRPRGFYEPRESEGGIDL